MTIKRHKNLIVIRDPTCWGDIADLVEAAEEKDGFVAVFFDDAEVALDVAGNWINDHPTKRAAIYYVPPWDTQEKITRYVEWWLTMPCHIPPPDEFHQQVLSSQTSIL